MRPILGRYFGSSYFGLIVFFLLFGFKNSFAGSWADWAQVQEARIEHFLALCSNKQAIGTSKVVRGCKEQDNCQEISCGFEYEDIKRQLALAIGMTEQERARKKGEPCNPEDGVSELMAFAQQTMEAAEEGGGCPKRRRGASTQTRALLKKLYKMVKSKKTDSTVGLETKQFEAVAPFVKSSRDSLTLATSKCLLPQESAQCPAPLKGERPKISQEQLTEESQLQKKWPRGKKLGSDATVMGDVAGHVMVHLSDSKGSCWADAEALKQIEELTKKLKKLEVFVAMTDESVKSRERIDGIDALFSRRPIDGNPKACKNLNYFQCLEKLKIVGDAKKHEKAFSDSKREMERLTETLQSILANQGPIMTPDSVQKTQDRVMKILNSYCQLQRGTYERSVASMVDLTNIYFKGKGKQNEKFKQVTDAYFISGPRFQGITGKPNGHLARVVLESKAIQPGNECQKAQLYVGAQMKARRNQ